MQSASLVLSAVIVTRILIARCHDSTGEAKAQKEYSLAPVTLLESGRAAYGPSCRSTARVPHQDSSDLEVGEGQKETDFKLVSNRLV